MTTATLTGIVPGLDEREYHAHPALSSTQARQILDSPARYQWLQQQPRKSTAAFDLGTAVHTKVLGTGANAITYPDEHLTPSGAVSTKAATVAWEEEQRAAGRVILSPNDFRRVDAMAEAVLAHDEARTLLEQPGIPEASIFGTCDQTGIDLRARFDFLPEWDGTAFDLKTTGTAATAHEFRRSVAQYRYDVQQGHYLDTLHFAAARSVEYRFIVVESKAPHFVGVIQLDDHFAAIGRRDALRARRTLRDCIDSGIWPTGLEDVAYIDAPYWLEDDNDMEV